MPDIPDPGRPDPPDSTPGGNSQAAVEAAVLQVERERDGSRSDSSLNASVTAESNPVTTTDLVITSAKAKVSQLNPTRTEATQAEVETAIRRRERALAKWEFGGRSRPSVTQRVRRDAGQAVDSVTVPNAAATAATVALSVFVITAMMTGASAGAPANALPDVLGNADASPVVTTTAELTGAVALGTNHTELATRTLGEVSNWSPLSADVPIFAPRGTDALQSGDSAEIADDDRPIWSRSEPSVDRPVRDQPANDEHRDRRTLTEGRDQPTKDRSKESNRVRSGGERDQSNEDQPKNDGKDQSSHSDRERETNEPDEDRSGNATDQSQGGLAQDGDAGRGQSQDADDDSGTRSDREHSENSKESKNGQSKKSDRAEDSSQTEDSKGPQKDESKRSDQAESSKESENGQAENSQGSQKGQSKKSDKAADSKGSQGSQKDKSKGSDQAEDSKESENGQAEDSQGSQNGQSKK